MLCVACLMDVYPSVVLPTRLKSGDMATNRVEELYK